MHCWQHQSEQSSPSLARQTSQAPHLRPLAEERHLPLLRAAHHHLHAQKVGGQHLWSAVAPGL